MALSFPTPEQQFAAAMAATPQSPARRPISNQLPAWMREDEPQGLDMEDMLAEHSTYRAVNGSVL